MVSQIKLGLFFAGTPSSNIIEYITIASTGDTEDFGDLSVATLLSKDVHHQLVEFFLVGSNRILPLIP